MAAWRLQQRRRRSRTTMMVSGVLDAVMLVACLMKPRRLRDEKPVRVST